MWVHIIHRSALHTARYSACFQIFPVCMCIRVQTDDAPHGIWGACFFTWCICRYLSLPLCLSVIWVTAQHPLHGGAITLTPYWRALGSRLPGCPCPASVLRQTPICGIAESKGKHIFKGFPHVLSLPTMYCLSPGWLVLGKACVLRLFCRRGNRLGEAKT